MLKELKKSYRNVCPSLELVTQSWSVLVLGSCTSGLETAQLRLVPDVEAGETAGNPMGRVDRLQSKNQTLFLGRMLKGSDRP